MCLSGLKVAYESIQLGAFAEEESIGKPVVSLALKASDSLFATPLVFTIKSPEIDVASILLKYRPSVSGLP